MAIDEKDVRKPPEAPFPSGLGLLKGLGVTMKHMLQPSITQEYPKERPDLPARSRGVIALKEANCTVCYKCARECPDWCIYIDAHKETHEPAGGGRGRSAKILDRFAIDFSLCMYCGICVEVCPFDALFWSPEFEYATYDIVEMVHEKEKLEEWTYTVLPPPPLEEGADGPSVALAASSAASDATAAASVVAEARTAVAASAAPAATAPATQPATTTGVPDAAAPGITSPRTDAAGVASGATGGGTGAGAEAEAAGAGPARERKEVSLDQETFDRVLAELLEKGTARRVAEGQAKRAAMIAARKKAEG